MNSLDGFAAGKLAQLEHRGIRRTLVETRRTGAVLVERDGRRLVSFSCNDYLGLSHHPRVKQAAAAALRRYGAGAAASRLITGNHPLFAALETRLAALKGTEAALVFGSGYLANLSIVPALAGAGDLVLVDAFAHACLFAGARLSGAHVEVFRHNDVEHAAALLEAGRSAARHAMILTDRVFSMDGDLAPVAALGALARRHDAWLLADDAHGTGLLAPAGADDVPLQMGTLSKALGSYGGFLCASAPVIRLLQSRGRGFVYSTGLPPASVAAALAALDIIESEPTLPLRPLRLARMFAGLTGLPTPPAQIVPWMIGTSAAALAASAALEGAGFLVAAIRPPTVPEGTARLRFTFTAAHEDAQVDALGREVRRLMAAQER